MVFDIVDYCKDAICDVNAYCVNGKDMYECQCEEGYKGNGKTCETVFQLSQVRAIKAEKEKECKNVF